VPKLAELGHEIAISAFYGLLGGPTKWQGHTVYPGGQHAYGGDIVGKHAKHFKADLVICLMDSWALPKETLAGMNVAFWMPVDCSPLGTRDVDGLQAARRHGLKFSILALTRFGQKQLTEVGFKSTYVPHGIDTSLWVPPADKKALREALGVDDRFLIFVDAANLSHDRKGFAELFAAFSRFRKRHEDALLMVHSLQTTSSGLDLPYIAARMGCLDGVAWNDQYLLTAGLIRPETLRSNYGAADLYANVSLGEGFGLPALQALSCGVPVVYTHGTGDDGGAGAMGSAMREVIGPVGYPVKSEPYWRPGHDAWWDKPLIGEIVKAFEKAYQRGPAYQAKVKASREHALKYDVNRVLEEYWKPALQEIEAKL
jgi:glycosyltransferase involved in cell wall biosynthesis